MFKSSTDSVSEGINLLLLVHQAAYEHLAARPVIALGRASCTDRTLSLADCVGGRRSGVPNGKATSIVLPGLSAEAAPFVRQRRDACIPSALLRQLAEATGVAAIELDASAVDLAAPQFYALSPCSAQVVLRAVVLHLLQTAGASSLNVL